MLHLNWEHSTFPKDMTIVVYLDYIWAKFLPSLPSLLGHFGKELRLIGRTSQYTDLRDLSWKNARSHTWSNFCHLLLNLMFP